MKYLISLILSAFALMGCEMIQGTPDNGLEGVTSLCFTYQGMVSTEVDTKSPLGDDLASNITYPFGIYIYNDGTTVPQMRGFDDIKANASKVNQDALIEWEYTFGDVSGSKAISVEKAKAIDVYAYYPYQTDHAGKHTQITFNTDQQIDWMWAKPVDNLTAQNFDADTVGIPLLFNHLMTCIEIEINKKHEGDINVHHLRLVDTRTTEEQNANPMLYGSGTFNAATGVIDITKATPVSEISIEPESTYQALVDEAGTAMYFIVPEIKEYTGGLRLYFCFNTAEESVTYYDIPVLPAELGQTGFLRGSKYRYSFVVDNTMEIYNVGMDITDDWKDGGKTDKEL